MLARLLRSRAALATAFTAVHLWIGIVGTVLIPSRAFWDLDLYRWWMWQGLHEGVWPVLSDDWVYPVGAVVPMLLPALVDAVGTRAYAIAWTVMITVLDAVAVWVLLRWARPRTTPGPHRDRTAPQDGHDPMVGAWWWVGFVALLGPVAVGRLDAVVAPVVVVALTVALRHPAVASALLTAGAWIKVAPGALLLPLVLVVRRRWRDLVLPAAAVCAAVAVVVGALGGGGRLFSFLSEQNGRGLQLESVGATAWVLRGLVDDTVRIWINNEIITWEIVGPGTTIASALLGFALYVGVAGATALLWWVRHRAGDRLDTAAFLARGALLLMVVLVVTNKVGSPQFIGWLAGPVAVGLARPGAGGLRSWRWPAVLVAVIAGLTQVVFPWCYDPITAGDVVPSLVLVVRNVLLVVLLVVVVRDLVRLGRVDRPDGPQTTAGVSSAAA